MSCRCPDWFLFLKFRRLRSAALDFKFCFWILIGAFRRWGQGMWSHRRVSPWWSKLVVFLCAGKTVLLPAAGSPTVGIAEVLKWLEIIIKGAPALGRRGAGSGDRGLLELLRVEELPSHRRDGRGGMRANLQEVQNEPVMAASVEVEPSLRPLPMTATQLAFHHQGLRTPPTMASESQDASLDHLLAHLESSKQALEHQVQQLLQENRLSKSAKKEQQWHIEGERLHSKLDSQNLALMEKEEHVRQLEKELRDSRGTIHQVQSRCREVENEKERGNLERTNLHADLEVAQSKFQNLEREHKLKNDVAEKQRRALESFSDKVEKQRVSFQKELEDTRRKMVELEEREQKYELAAQLASQHLAEKERQLKSLRESHENLLAIQKVKQADERNEVKEVSILLESFQEKCGQQNALILELEEELGRIKNHAHQLDARFSASEAESHSKSSMLEKLQQELEAVTLANSKAQTEDLKTQVQKLNQNLQDVENMLSDERALRFKAECALNEYKIREKSFLKVEQDGKELQEEVKWRNEQFESLEEAHNKMRDQFHEGLSMWASERAAIVHDIELLTENVQSRDFVIHDLRSQVKLLEQSLAHEENCRKLLDFQLADAKAGYDSVSAECFGAQSSLESLRENSNKELVILKDTLAQRDIQLKELHVKELQIDCDQRKILHLEAELDSCKSRCERLQQAIEEVNAEVIETGVPLDSEVRDSLTSSLTEAEATITKKEVEMKELELELERTRTLSELLRTSLSEAEEKRLKGNIEVTQSEEKLSMALSAKEQHANDLEMEVERLQLIVNDVRKCNAEAERRIRALEDRLQDAHRELQAKSHLSHSFLSIQEHEDVVHAMRSECQALQRQLTTCDFEKFEIEKHRDKLLAEEQQMYHEKQELVSKLERLGKHKNARVKDLLDQIEKQKHVIRTLETRCSSLEQDVSEQVSLTENIREELIAEKLIAQDHQERAQALDTALSAAAAAKDASLKEIKDSLLELTVICKGGAATSQGQLRISSIEDKLKKQDVLDGQLVSLLGEVELVAQGLGCLNIELNSLKDDSKLTKTEFETRLKAVEGLFSSSFAELQEISEQVGKMNAKRTSPVDVLNKDGAFALLNTENSNLNIDKIRLESNADVLEEKLHHLVKEAESNKAMISTLNVNMKAAEAGVAALHDFHGKLEESENQNKQLMNADQAVGLERKFRATEESLLDKEQRLAASGLAGQQMASEVTKSKICLAQKENDETASRDLEEHLEAQLKVNERQLMLQCDVENAVKTSDDNVALVRQLTLSKDEMGHAMELTKRALKEKFATLATSETEIKDLQETQRLTVEALDSCKDRLSNETTSTVAREQDMRRLCEDIERANQKVTLADVKVQNLQASLICLESTTETRLESCERRLQEGAADLAKYKENCASLLDLIEKKDSRIQQLEFEVTHAERELERQIVLAEQGEQELLPVSEQLQSKTKMLASLQVELATLDNLVRESDTQKRGLEEEVRELKSSLSVASRDLKQKSMDIEDQLQSVNPLKREVSHQGDVHSIELVISNAAEERDSKVSKLEAALHGAHDELREVQKVLSIKEVEKRVLSLRLSELESLVEKGMSQVSHLQSDLQFARVNLDAETEQVWRQGAARNEFEIELDGWKVKAAALTENQAKFESVVSRLQGEIDDWKEVTEHTKNLSQMELDTWEMKAASNHATIEKSQVEVMEWKAVAERTVLQSAELEKSMQAVQESVVVWESMISSLADEGDIAKLQLEIVLKQVHDEFRTLHGELANTKDMILFTRQEGLTLKAEFLSTVTEAIYEQTALALTGEGDSLEIQHLQAVASDHERELGVWKARALNSEVEAQSQLKKWSQRGEEWESFYEILERAFLDFENAVLACKSDAVSDLERDLKLDIQVSLQNLRNEVEEAKSEVLEFKELAASETQRAQLEFQDCVKSLQAEVEVWKGRAAVATDEDLQMHYQFEDLIKNLQRELQNWRQFEALTLGEDSGAQAIANDTVVVAGMEKSSDTSDITLNPFYQEDEGCSSAQDNDDGAATQLDGWKTKSLAEGRKLILQLRASLKYLQFELESRKQALGTAKHDSVVHRRDDTGLQSLVKALQEEAVEIRAELAVWKNKAHETGIQKVDLEKAIDRLNADVEVWKDRSAMSAGQRIVARRQLDDLAKQVKSLTGELKKWKDVATEANEGAAKLQSEVERWQKESEEMRFETNEWMQKALELNCVLKDFEEKWKQSGGELEHLRAELERYKGSAMKAQDEEKVTKIELLDTLGKFEDDLEVMSGNSIGGYSTAGDRSLKDEDLDCSLLSSGHVSNEWRHEQDISLQTEIEDWKKRVAEEEYLRQASETSIKELRMELDELKKGAALVAVDGQRERVELEKKVKDLEAKDHFAEIEGELQVWKKRTADAEEECTSLRDTYDNIIQELQLELAQWKAKSETATKECESVRADLENVVHDLQNQAEVWKLKAEKALENVVKTQEYEDLIKALEEELCLWMQRTQESKLLQQQLENEQVLLKESLVGTQNELRKWKDKWKVSAVTSTSIKSVQGLTAIPEENDEVNIYPVYDEEEDDVNIDHTVESGQLQDWKSRAEQAELLQLQLEDVLAETQTELHEWKQKTADFSLAAEFLKEELESLVEEGRLDKEELLRSNSELEAWRTRAQDSQTQLESSNLTLQKLEETVAAITSSTRSLMEELDLTIEGGLLEKQEFFASISALKTSILLWKEKVSDSESMQSELKTTLLETQSELQDLKEKATVAVATIFEENSQQIEVLSKTINELEEDLLEWKSRAQEGVSVQRQLERALLEAEENAGITATNTQSLKNELDRTITERSSEIQELRTAIIGLEAELSPLRESGPSRFTQLLQLQNTLTETQSQLLECQDKATAASQAEVELRQAVEVIRVESVQLENFIRALQDELHEWKERAEHLETLQVQMTCSLAASADELQKWKQKATEMVSNPNLRTLDSQWKVKAQAGEFLHLQTEDLLTEARIEIKKLKEQIEALDLFTDTLKDELKGANEFVSTLTTQLSTQKQNEETLLKLNQQLEADLVLARQEAHSRKHQMTQILHQLEGNRESHMGLQMKLHLAQHRLLGIEKVHGQTENVSRGIGETTAAKAICSEPEDGMNPAVNKMRQELFPVKSLVIKLEHVRANDAEESQGSSSAAGDDGLAVVEDITLPRAASFPSRPEAVLQTPFKSCKAVGEAAHRQMKKSIDGPTRARAHSLARFKVLADVNGNSPRAHDIMLRRKSLPFSFE